MMIANFLNTGNSFFLSLVNPHREECRLGVGQLGLKLMFARTRYLEASTAPGSAGNCPFWRIRLCYGSGPSAWDLVEQFQIIVSQRFGERSHLLNRQIGVTWK